MSNRALSGVRGLHGSTAARARATGAMMSEPVKVGDTIHILNATTSGA